MRKVKEIRIKFVDMWSNFSQEDNDFVRILSERFKVVISDEPDYIFYSCFGKEYLRYDCVRILLLSELGSPDMSICDYAIGNDRCEFEDRYLRYPIYALHIYRKTYQELFKPRELDLCMLERKFCNFVYSNFRAQQMRTDIFVALSNYKRVDSGGRFLNNIGEVVLDKLDFIKDYKFTIACENYNYRGNISEKIVEAFATKSVPIYYGPKDVVSDFNKNAFINVSDFGSLDELARYVEKVDNDDELYLRMLSENPIITPFYEESLKEFLYNIFNQDLKEAFRRPITPRLITIERQLRRKKIEETKIFWFFRAVIGRITRKRMEKKIFNRIHNK